MREGRGGGHNCDDVQTHTQMSHRLLLQGVKQPQQPQHFGLCWLPNVRTICSAYPCTSDCFGMVEWFPVTKM
jgi:hypothetical protein